MPPRVAGIFSGGHARARNPSISKEKEEAKADTVLTDDNQDNDDFGRLLAESLNKEKDSKGPKYIYSAAEKAKERKQFLDQLKTKRIEREVAKIEETQGPLLRFDSTSITGEVTLLEPQMDRISPEEKSDGDPEFDFEAMRMRYMERRDRKDILKLCATPNQLRLIVNWVELSKNES